MLILTQTTDKIQVKLSGSVTSAQLQCYSSYRDSTSSDITPGRTVTLTNNTTYVDIVPSPSASTSRSVEYLSVYNSDTASATVTFSINDNGTLYEINVATLSAGQKAEYQAGVGFKVLDDTLETDVTNNNASGNTIQDITGLSFSVTSGKTYWFRFNILFTSASTGNGHRFSINGPATSFLVYQSLFISSATTASLNISGITSYDLPAASTLTSPAAGGTCWIEGIVTFSASGTLIGRFASELGNIAIVAKAGSVVYYKQLD
jgi:hypothetical protein